MQRAVYGDALNVELPRRKARHRARAAACILITEATSHGPPWFGFGRRNYAMLMLIASYGLRGGEARALRLSDIAWVHDEIIIFAPKAGRRRRLPLTRPVGEAIFDYLLADRPPSPQRRSSSLAGRRMARCGAR